MKPCPHCGTQLDARLVDAIRDKDKPESCPMKPKEQGK